MRPAADPAWHGTGQCLRASLIFAPTFLRLTLACSAPALQLIANLACAQPVLQTQKIRMPRCSRDIHGAAARVRSSALSVRSAGPREQGPHRSARPAELPPHDASGARNDSTNDV